MVRDELNVLSAFLAVAEERSFTRAAAESASASAIAISKNRARESPSLGIPRRW
jgi:hypothetical protein